VLRVPTAGACGIATDASQAPHCLPEKRLAKQVKRLY
jgi:hypothetical protein